MTRGQRSILALVLVAIAVAALVTGPAGPGTVRAQPPHDGQLLRGPSTTTAAPPLSPAILIVDANHGSPAPGLAYNTQFDEYLVVWRESGAIRGQRVSSRGLLIGSPFSIETSSVYSYGPPRVAYDSKRNRYLVVWPRTGGSGSPSLHGRFVPALGPNPAVTAFVVDGIALPVDTISLAYALSQDEFFVVWNQDAGSTFRQVTWGRRIPADGSGPLPPFALAQHATENRRRPDVAYNLARNEYLVTVDDGDKVNENIFGTRLTAGGIVLGGGEFTIAGWPDDEYGASVAACPAGDQYLVAWHSIRPADKSDGIFARLVSGDGSPGAVVQLDARDYWQWRVTHAACGVTNDEREAPRYLVVWSEDITWPVGCDAREVFLTGAMGDVVSIAAGECTDVDVVGGATNHLILSISGSRIHARIVGNTRPQAHFTVTPQEGDSTTDFVFDASGCTDTTDWPGYLQVRWDWENDGIYDTAWSTTKVASHRFPLADWQSTAMFMVQMQVTDGHGATDETRAQVKVLNAPPSAFLAVVPTSGNTATTFLFDASGSSDPEGGPLQYRWDWQGDGTYDTGWSEEALRETSFPTPGTFNVRVQVQDNWGQSDSQSRTVVVGQGSNAPPTAAFTVSPSSGETNTIFQFDASGSTDAEDGAPGEYRWDWQDDGTFDIPWSSSPQAKHTFPTAGNYRVRLEVRDSGGLIGPETRTVLVAEPGALEQLYLPLIMQGFP